MKLSICIVNFNSGLLLISCLKSIKANPPSWDYEVIVVDNGSTDGSQICVNDFDCAHLIQNEKNEGFAKANNQAAAISSGEYLLLLNADTEVQANALDELLIFAEAHPQMGLVTARLYNPDGSPQIGFNIRRLPDFSSAITQLLLIDEAFPQNPLTRRAGYWDLDYDLPQMVEQPAASALLARRTTWDQVKGFDEVFSNWYNDCDLCKRVIAAGWKIWFCPSSHILHYGGRGSASRSLVGVVTEVYQSQRRYFYKQWGRLGYWVISGLIVCGMILRLIILRGFPNFQKQDHVSYAKPDTELLRRTFKSVLVDTIRTWNGLIASPSFRQTP